MQQNSNMPRPGQLSAPVPMSGVGVGGSAQSSGMNSDPSYHRPLLSNQQIPVPPGQNVVQPPNSMGGNRPGMVGGTNQMATMNGQPKPHQQQMQMQHHMQHLPIPNHQQQQQQQQQQSQQQQQQQQQQSMSQTQSTPQMLTQNVNASGVGPASGMGGMMSVQMPSQQMAQQQGLLQQQQQLQQQQVRQSMSQQGSSQGSHASVSSDGSNAAHRPRKPWHGDGNEHRAERDQMIDRIIQLLQQRRPNATPDWCQKLPSMARRLEDSLYWTADSFEAYNESSSLKTRLQQLALTISNTGKGSSKQSKNSSNHPPSGGSSQPSMPQASQPMTGQQHISNNSMQLSQHYMPMPMQPDNIHMANSQMVGQQQSNASKNAPGLPMHSHVLPLAPQQQTMQMQQQAQPSLPHGHQQQSQSSHPNHMGMHIDSQSLRTGAIAPGTGVGVGAGPNVAQVDKRYIRVSDVHPLMGAQPGIVPSDPSSSTGENVDLSISMPGSSGVMMDDNQMNVFMAGYPNNGVPSNGNAKGPKPSQQAADDHRKQVLKQQQQRLLLLRHASKCPHESGRCVVTPHCGAMKHLWKHIMSCKDQECKVPHCVSSRYVLSHYSKCKETQCPVCGPVREAIRRNYDRSRHVLNLSKSFPIQGGAVSTVANGSDGGTGSVANSALSSSSAGSMMSNISAGPYPSGGTQDIRQDVPPPPPVAPQPAPAHPVSKKKEREREKAEREREKAEKEKEKERLKDASQSSASLGSGSSIPASTHSSMSGALQGQTQGVQNTVVGSAPKPAILDPVSCALYSFTTEQIMEHVQNILETKPITATQIKAKCLPLVEEILNDTNGDIFARPVDPVALRIHDYFDIIKKPMDLGTIKKRLEGLSYRSVEEFVDDVHLVFDNAMLYNPKSCEVHTFAKNFKKQFDTNYNNMLKEMKAECEAKKENANNCLLCGESSVKYEPPVYYCNGRCNGQRIRRNVTFYSTLNNSYHWCTTCYNEMKENQQIQTGDSVIYKRDLQKKKHSEDAEEPWVQCDLCQRWVHQICTLFNGRRNVSDNVAFVCPACVILKRLKKGPSTLMTNRKMQADDLPKCKLSDFLELRVRQRLESAYLEWSQSHDIPLEKVEKASPLFIRQVASIDKLHHVREGVLERYKGKGYPTEFPCRSKCVVLFQNIEGQDVILFGMYVYEYGHKCAAPNQRRVYISYLDSVHYFRPRQFRTIVYHEILIAYLEYVKARGFHTAHIWACPPLRGDDYILYCHPQDQKTPKDDRLRHWYADMLKACEQRGIVVQTSDLYKEFLADPNNDVTVLPYFEGDYWVNEAEVIIKNLGSKANAITQPATTADDAAGDDGEDKVESNTKKRKSVSKSKRTRNSRGATPLLTKSERDPVMAKLASIIEPMKEAFFVAKLHPDEYAQHWAAVRQEELEREAATNDPESSSKRARLLQEEALSSSSADMPTLCPNTEETSAKMTSKSMPSIEKRPRKSPATARLTETRSVSSSSSSGVVKNEDPDTTYNHGKEPATGASDESSGGALAGADQGDAEAKETEEDASSAGKTDVTAAHSKESGEAEGGEGSKPSGDAEDNSGNTSIARAESVREPLNKDIDVKDDTEDPDDTQESEHFDTRQSFLNLCQGNHYQFDQLRRAKHTSLMVLYHLHNPDAPKFVAMCYKCGKDILQGVRHHCDICDQDICIDCLNANGPAVHPHPLKPMTVQSGAPTAQILTEQQRQERNRSMKLHLELLVHASTCHLEDCTKNCRKMKVQTLDGHYLLYLLYLTCMYFTGFRTP